MTDPDDVVVRARQALDGITPGPWLTDMCGGRIFVGNRADGRQHGLWEIVHAASDRLCDLTERAAQKAGANARLIAAAPSLVDELTTEVEKLRAENRVLALGPHVTARALAEKQADKDAAAADKAETERDEWRAKWRDAVNHADTIAAEDAELRAEVEKLRDDVMRVIAVCVEADIESVMLNGEPGVVKTTAIRHALDGEAQC